MTAIDWRELADRDGFTLRAEKFYDEQTRPDDYGLYPDGAHTPKQVAAWERDEWQYVGLEITASIEGVALGTASLWGIQSGRLTHTDEDDNITGTEDFDPLYSDDYLGELADEAIAVARENLAAINAALAGEKTPAFRFGPPVPAFADEQAKYGGTP